MDSTDKALFSAYNKLKALNSRSLQSSEHVRIYAVVGEDTMLGWPAQSQTWTLFYAILTKRCILDKARGISVSR